MINAISKTNSTRSTVSTTPATVRTAQINPAEVRIFSDRNIVVSVGIGVTADEDDSCPVAERTAEIFSVAAGEVISVVAVTGETSGSVWVTEV